MSVFLLRFSEPAACCLYGPSLLGDSHVTFLVSLLSNPITAVSRQLGSSALVMDALAEYPLTLQSELFKHNSRQSFAFSLHTRVATAIGHMHNPDR